MKLIGLFLILNLTLLINAQTVISNQGESYDNGTNSIDFTIGEPIIETNSNGSNTVTQGFHQTKLIVTEIDNLDVNLLIKAYPNPSTGVVFIEIKEFRNLQYSIFDAIGKLVINGQFTNETTEINLTSKPTGQYLLVITNSEQKKLKTYQLIKN